MCEEAERGSAGLVPRLVATHQHDKRNQLPPFWLHCRRIYVVQSIHQSSTNVNQFPRNAAECQQATTLLLHTAAMMKCSRRGLNSLA